MIRPRVLLADDHPGLIAAIGRLLATHDYEIVGSVENGGRLLEEAARLQPDIIVADLFPQRIPEGRKGRPTTVALGAGA